MSLVAVLTVGSGLGLIPVWPEPAAADDELFDGLVEVPEVGSEGEVVPVEELPALPSDEPVELEPTVPEGDFTDPPLPPNAPLALEEAYEDAQDPSFDLETSVPVENLTTATREVFDNTNGTRTVVVASQPVRYRDENGEWADIDLEFAVQPDGDVVVDETRVPVELPAEDPAAVDITTTAGEIGVSAPDVAGEASGPVEADGSVAVVEGEDGIETHIAATVWGFEHSVVVPDAGSPSSYALELTLPEGVTARQGEGGVEMVNAAGQVVSSFGGGLAFDSAETGWAGEETSVTVTLVETDGQAATVEVDVADGWFEDPARVFPVTIDPYFVGSVTTGASDTWVISGQSSSNWGHSQLRVGTVNSGTTYARSLLRFPLQDADPGTIVAEAHLSLYAEESQSCTATPVTLGGLSAGFDSNTVWSNQPGALSGVTTTSTNKGFSASCPAGRFDLDATALVQSWMNGNVGNAGLRLRAGNESLNSNRKIFSSGDGDAGQVPKLYITFNTPPPAPSQTAPSGGATVMTATPTLTASAVTDADAGTDVDYWFSVWTDDSPQWGGQTISSGWVEEPTWTVPAGELADGGQYYRATYASDGETFTASGRTSFNVNLRLGTGGPSAYQPVGPVNVNLATGNATVGASGPAYPSVAGPISASFAYNSLTPARSGLSGKYWNDDNQNGLFDDGDPVVERTDPAVSFGWGQYPPQGGLGEDDFLVRWRGWITVPTTGTWYFGGVHDNGMRIEVDDTSVFDQWNTYNWLAAYGTPTVSLTAGTRVPIQVTYRDTGGDAFVQLWARRAGVEYPVPSSWLRPLDQPESVLPQGWTLSTPVTASGPVQANITNDLITFRTADGGACCAFLRNVNLDTWSAAPGSTGNLSRDDDGKITLRAADGTVYQFRTNGMLQTASTPSDSDTPTAWSSTYGLIGDDDLPRVTAITDPIGSTVRSIGFTYSSQSGCPTPPSGFDAWSSLPDGLLCKISYWDDRRTYVFYKNGQLARVRNPGDEITDFAYDNGRVTSVRSPLAADALAAGVRADDGSLDYEIAYNGAGQVSGITLPAPTQGATRPGTDFTYTSTHTDVTVDGAAEPNGYSRRVSHDAAGQATSAAGADGLASTAVWDSEGRVVSTIDPLGLRTNTVYDAYGNATDVYGPSPQGWFSGQGAPTSNTAQVPHSHTDYDEGYQGLAATWWDNVNLAGAPMIHRADIGSNNGEIDKDWGTQMPAGLTDGDYYSGRFTGWIQIDTERDWDFRFIRDGKVRLYIDDELVIDEWTASTTNADGDDIHLDVGPHEIVIEYAETTGDASIELRWDVGGTWGVVPAAKLRPGFGNPTTETGPMGKVVERTYDSPHLHAQDIATADPGGLALSTDTDYEGIATDQFRRPISREAPTGVESTTIYYSQNATRDDPCTSGDDPVHQGGLTKKATGPDPDGGGSGTGRATEVIYDISGRRVAERVGSEDWTCFSYDTRGRIATAAWPAFGGEAARTVTYDYAVVTDHDDDPGTDPVAHPLVSSVSDTTGTITTYQDLLGRTVATTDVWGNTTEITYDLAGRQTGSEGAGGVTANTFDTLGRLDTVALDGEVLADVTYDSMSRLTSVDYPNGTGQAGNGTRLDSITYNADTGMATGIVWKTAAGTLLTSHARTFDLSGDVTDETIDGTDPYGAGPNYLYDDVGRLTTAHVPGHDITYNFAQSGGCGQAPTAGLNTNRTSMVDNGVTTTYCYNSADQLTETTAGGIGTDLAYDAHGNTTLFGDGVELVYDAANQHVETTDDQGTTSTADDATVRYTRDATGGIVAREATGEATLRYSGGPAGVALTMDTSNQVLERVVGLPGGASVTLGPTERWSYPNLQGSVAAIADGDGAKVGSTYTYDPYGNPLAGIPDNREGNHDVGWLGGVGTEHADGTPQLIEMGARVYSPLLGRFLEVDPQPGASANDYDYGNADPINNTDRSGNRNIYGAHGVDPIDATFCQNCDPYFRPVYSGVGPPPSSSDLAAAIAARDAAAWDAAFTYAAAEKKRQFATYVRSLRKKAGRLGGGLRGARAFIPITGAGEEVCRWLGFGLTSETAITTAFSVGLDEAVARLASGAPGAAARLSSLLVSFAESLVVATGCFVYGAIHDFDENVDSTIDRPWLDGSGMP